MSQEGGINTLKHLLFEEESKKFAQLEEKFQEFQGKVADDFENLKIPEDEVEQLVDHITEIMPERLGPAITKTLQTQKSKTSSTGTLSNYWSNDQEVYPEGNSITF